MEVKGVTVKSVSDFVKTRHPDRYDAWLAALPEASRKIHEDVIFTASWYDLDDAVVAPTRVTADMFFGGDLEKASVEGGSWVAETAIRGVHKAFIKIGSPRFLVKMAGKVFSSYFKDATLAVVKGQDKSVTAHMTDFDPPSVVMEHRIRGWMLKALDISGAKGVTVTITRSLTKGDPVTEFVAEWD